LPPLLYLAPLHGVTNRIFRKAFFNHFSGFDGVMAPFVLAVDTDQLKKNHFKDLLPFDASGIPVVPQLLGNDPFAFVKTARYLAGLGYAEVNWNLGCPYPMVANKKRGSGLLPFPGMIEKILEEVCAKQDIALSVKLRLGRYESQEIINLMPILNRYPLKKVIIHPRIGTQMYKGEVSLDGFAEALSLCRHPVMYNGDIKDEATFAQLQKRFPSVTEWMIGRWAIANPFLPEQIKKTDRSAPAPHLSDPVAVIRAFHDELYGSYREALSGPAHLLDKMKEIWSYLGRSFPSNAAGVDRIIRSKTVEAYDQAVSAILSP